MEGAPGAADGRDSQLLADRYYSVDRGLYLYATSPVRVGLEVGGGITEGLKHGMEPQACTQF